MKSWGSGEFWGLGSEFDPDWVLTKDQIELRNQLIEVCRKIIRPQAIRSDKTYEFPRESMDALAELGLLGLIIPKELGGLGENHVCINMVVETIARYGGASIALVYSMHITAVCRLLTCLFDSPFITDLIKRMNKDKLIGTTATSDPSTGGHFWFTLTSKIQELSDNSIRCFKFSSWCTSAGFADFYMCLVASSPEGDYSDASILLVFNDEVRASTEDWVAMGVRGNQSGPLIIDGVFSKDRLIGDIGGSATLLGETTSIYYMCLSATWNGVSLAAMDVAKKHMTRKAHGDVGVRICDYPAIQDYMGRCITSTNGCRTSLFLAVEGLDKATNNCEWFNRKKSETLFRVPFINWFLQIKYNSTENVIFVTGTMLKGCGGEGYKEELGLERLFRDGMAGSLMSPSNEIIRDIMGKSVLLGSEAVDPWEKNCNHQVIHHELKKMKLHDKKSLLKRLSEDVHTEEQKIPLKHPYQDTDFDNPFNTAPPTYNNTYTTSNGVTHTAAINQSSWTSLKLLSRSDVNSSMTSFVFALPTKSDHTGCFPGQYLQARVSIAGKYHIRSFSPVSTPDDFGKIEIVIKFESHGIFSQFFKGLSVGSEIEFQGPSGGFEYEHGKLDELTILASGAGITPGLQLIRSIIQNNDDKTKVNLLYFSESFDKLLYYAELKKYSENDSRINIVFTLGEVLENWDGDEGFIDEMMIKKCIQQSNGLSHKVMMCGGPSMTMSCLHSLRILGYPSDMIFIYGQFGTDQIRAVYGRNIKLSGHRCDNVV